MYYAVFSYVCLLGIGYLMYIFPSLSNFCLRCCGKGMRQWLAAYCLSLAMVPWTNGGKGQAQRGFPDGSPFPPERDGPMSRG